MTISTQGINVTASAEGQSAWVLTDFVRFLIKGDATNGAYSMIEVTSLPQGSPPPHFHHECDEAYYILEGEYEFYDLGSNSVIKATPGTFLNILRTTPHTYKNVGTTNAKMLVINTPAGFEGFLEEIGMPSNDVNNPPVMEGPPDLEAIVALAQKYKTSLAG
jgi:quercetin dioxygenase-like cupin family protein